MEEIIKNFKNQFRFKPEIENEDNLFLSEEFIVMGMGGSHLPADILKIRDPYLNLKIHKNYNLPHISPEKLEKSLLIAISHSGNTEETLDFAKKAIEHNYHLGVITTGGKLLELAIKNNIPYIKVPADNLQPRHSLGYMTKALSKFLDNDLEEELNLLPQNLDSDKTKEEGKKIAEEIKDKLPIIYASERNEGLAYIWKIKINETSKAPAFSNIFPELNHNELAGFDTNPKKENLVQKFSFIFLNDPADHPKVQKRMILTKEIYNSKSLPVITSKLQGNTPFEKIFNSLILSDWVSLFLCKEYGVDPFSNNLVEEFKKQISNSDMK
jgi:glucose/mannose-6-phosphate isomerase